MVLFDADAKRGGSEIGADQSCDLAKNSSLHRASKRFAPAPLRSGASLNFRERFGAEIIWSYKKLFKNAK